MTTDTHDAHDDPHDAGGHHDHPGPDNDAPLVRPDGTAEPPHRRLSLGIGIGGTVLFLLIIGGLILYVNRNGDHAATTTHSETGGGAAPEALVGGGDLKEAVAVKALRSGPAGQLQPGRHTQETANIKPLAIERADRNLLSPKAAGSATTTPTRAPTQGAGTRAPATPTKPASATTWKDPDGRFAVRLPAGWTVDESAKDEYTVVLFVGPSAQNGPWLYLNAEEQGDYSLDDFVALDQKAQQGSKKFDYKFGPVTETTVGGQAAKTYPYTYTPKEKPSQTPWNGQIWETIADGTRYNFQAGPIGTYRADVSAIVASVAFAGSDNSEGGQLSTWTDPNGLITLKHPNTWTASLDADDPTSVLVLKSTGGMTLYFNIDDQFGTVDKEIQAIRDARMKNTVFNFEIGAIFDLKIGGEPAKGLPYTYVKKSNATIKGAGRDYAVNHNNKYFQLEFVNIGGQQADVNAILESITFGGAANTTGKTTTWQDKKGLVKLQYPNGWVASASTSDENNVLTLEGPDGVTLDLYIIDPQRGTVDQEIKADTDYYDPGNKDLKNTYTLSPVIDLKIGGESAKALPYQYVPKSKPNATKGVGQIWEVNKGGKEFYFQASPLNTHKAEVEAIIATVTFLK